MKPIIARILASLLLVALLGGAGCGGGEKKEQVDLAAQLAALSGDADAKVNALAEIAKLGAAAAPALDKVAPLLKDDDTVVRRTAAYVLGAIGPAAKSAVPELQAMMKSEVREEMTAAVNALALIDPSSAPGVKIQNVSN